MRTPFFTVYTTDNEGGFYVKALERLMLDCTVHGVKLEAEQMDSHGDWVVNATHKVFPILDRLRRAEGPFVFLDVDMRILSTPLAFDALTCDLALSPMNEPGNRLKVRGTPIYLTPAALPFVEEWARLCQQVLDGGPCPDKNPGDHGLLDYLYRTGYADLDVDMLPVEYCVSARQRIETPALVLGVAQIPGKAKCRARGWGMPS